MKRLCIILALLLGLCACGQAAEMERRSLESYAPVISLYGNYIRGRESEFYYDENNKWHPVEDSEFDFDAFVDSFAKELNVPEELQWYLMASLFYYSFTYGYAFYDINKDGIQELIVFWHGDQINAIYTLKQGKPVLLGAYGDKYRCDMIDADGMIYTH